MIFVTVGTHEQPFNRLVRKIDELKKENIITEDVFIQLGYTEYIPKQCEWSKFLSYKEMQEKINDARIIITHGGPASFIAPLQIGKIPIVVPRQYEYNEHVNNHQVEFVKIVENRNKNIIGVYDIEQLKNSVLNYNQIIKNMKNKNNSNNIQFCEKFETIVEEVMKK